MKTLNLFIAFVVSSMSYGQIYFNELVDLSNPESEVFRSILYNNQDNTFWIVGSRGYSNEPKVFHFDSDCQGLDTFNIKTSTSGDVFIPGYQDGLFMDNTGNLIIPGQVNYYNTGDNAVLQKISQNGDTLWVKEFGDTLFFDALIGGFQDTDSTYIFNGFSGTIIGAQQVDYWLIKTDTNGNVLWQNNFGGAGTDFPFNISLATDGGYVLAGYTSSFGAGSNDVYVVKTDSQGNLEWQNWFGTPNSEGGSAITLANGNIIVYGQYRFEDPNFPGNKAPHGMVMELDQNGNQLWEKIYANVDSATYSYYTLSEWFNSAVVVSDGYVMCGASVDSIDNNPLGWILKTDFNGNELWSRRYRKRNQDNYLQDVVALPNGDLVFTGFVFPENAGQTQDGWLLRTNCLGFDGPPDAQGNWHNGSLNTVVLENNSERFGNGIVDWGDGTSTTFTEFDDTLISHQYATSGNYSIQLVVNACNESDTTYISADATVTGLIDHANFEFNLYPNPAQNQITIALNQLAENSQIIIQNLAGQIVYQTSNLNQELIQIDINEFARGTYLVNVINSNRVLTKKLIVN